MFELSRRTGISLTLGAVVVGTYLLHCVYYLPQINDDAFITFRYAKQLSLGNGPYFNVGEHVEGYTNPLMMVLMSLSLLWTDDLALLPVAKGICVAAGVLTLFASWALTARLLRSLESIGDTASVLAWAAPALVAVNSAFAVNSTTGLETTMFAAGITMAMWLGLVAEDENRWAGSGIVLALLVLTRPEGIAVAAALLASRALGGELRRGSSRRIWLVDAQVVGATQALLLAMRFTLYDGEILPNTYFAKMGGMAWKMPAGEYLWFFLSEHLGGVLCLLALLPLAGGAALRRRAFPVLAVLLFGLSSVFLTGADWMLGYRLLVPYTAAWSVLVVVGLAVLFDLAAPSRARAMTAVVSLALVIGLVWLQSPYRKSLRRVIEIRRTGYLEGHFALADWLGERRVAGDTVALMDIGIVGFRNQDLRVLDITGLTDRHIAKSPGLFLSKRFDSSYVFDQRPRFLVIAFSAPRSHDKAKDLAALEPWTETEYSLMTDPRFREGYYRPRPLDPLAGTLSRFAARFGATRVFEHLHPMRRYFLFAYEYRGGADSPSSS